MKIKTISSAICIFSMMIVLLLPPVGLAQQTIERKAAEEKPLEKFALLVGINDYEHVTKLEGAVQDVKDLQALLESKKFGFPKDHIVTLTDKEATAGAITSAFKNHLIENAKKNPDAIVIFHYSGHGSFVKDDNDDELDEWDETLVTVNSRDKEGKNFDITDDEIGELFEELARYTPNITFIFDSCHSGTVNRGSATVREVPRDERKQPNRGLKVRSGGKSRDAKTVDLLPSSDRYVTITGCSPTEKSHEVENGGRHNGALTFYLIEALKRARPDTTYRELMKEVAGAVNIKYPYQNPQVEGNLRQRVFAGSANPEDYYIEVQKVEGKMVTLRAGAAQGLKVGSLVAIYEPGTYRLVGEEKKLANATVMRVDPLTAAAEIAELPEGKQITTDARAAIISPLFGATRMRVALGPVGAVRGIDPGAKVMASVADSLKDSKLVELFSGSPRAASAVKEGDAWDVAVMRGKFGEVFKDRQIAARSADEKTAPLPAKDAEVYYITSRDGEPLFDFFVGSDDPKGAQKIADALEKLAKQQNLLALENRVSPLNSAIKVTPLRVNLSRNAEGKFKIDSEEPITLDDNKQDYEFDQGIYFRLLIENQSDKDLYVTVFDISTDGSIKIVFPKEGARETVRKGTSIRTGVYVTTPPAGNEVFKVIAATSYSDFSFLMQGGIKRAASSPLELLMSQALEGTRSDEVPVEKLDEWGTAQIRFVIGKK